MKAARPRARRSSAKTMLEVCTDAQTDMPLGIPRGAMCVQRFDDSLNSAIHITYRVSLRSSSMREPRDPLLKVLINLILSFSDRQLQNGLVLGPWRADVRGTGVPSNSRRSKRVVSQWFEGRAFPPDFLMILPQVHLRKPCYDFYFL